jgi:hypothetical protein
MPMPRQRHLTVELLDMAIKQRSDREIAAKAKEALIMALLREYQISQGKAAEILKVSRYDLFDLMKQYCIPVIDLTLAEIEAELKLPFLIHKVVLPLKVLCMFKNALSRQDSSIRDHCEETT